MPFIRQLHNQKPLRWGSFQDVQYSIKRNMESIYKCNPDDEMLIMPLFWGLPPLDYSGFNNHGTNHGAIYKDGSLDFNGDDYVDISDGDALDFGGASESFTVSLWMKPDVVSAHQVFLMKGDSNDDFWRVHLWNDNKITCSLNAIDFSSNTGVFTVGNLYHIVGVFNKDGNGQVYIDGSANGAPVALNNEVLSLAIQVTRIGNSTFPVVPSQYFNGTIPEIRIAKAVHTADQIAMFYDRPWDLYRPVRRPVYFLPAVGVTIPIFMQNMRGGYNLMSRGGFIN